MAHVCGMYRYNQCRAHVVLLVELEAKIDKLEHERAALLGRGNPQGGGPSGGGGPAVHHQPSAGGGGGHKRQRDDHHGGGAPKRSHH